MSAHGASLYRKNYKHQKTNNKQYPNLKFQCPNVLVIEYWNLSIVCNLVLVIWNLSNFVLGMDEILV